MTTIYAPPPPPAGSDFHSPAWQQWLLGLSSSLKDVNKTPWSGIDFTVSNLLSIAIRLHSDTQGLQGGNSTEHYHLTLAEITELQALIAGTLSATFSTLTVSTLTVSTLLKCPQYTTASAPAYQKGAVYFDTTLNKLRVGGATAWETITSI